MKKFDKMNIQENRQFIIDQLRNGIFVFHYRKKNGKLRKARGTTCPDLIPKRYHPKGTGNLPKGDIIPYFDIDRYHWRCFRLHRVKSYYPQSSEHGK